MRTCVFELYAHKRRFGKAEQKIGLRTIEKYHEQTHPIFCYAFPNLRLGV